jgi:monoamine oxidase
MTRWGQDQWAHGSYSYPAVGVTPEDYLSLAAPIENKVFFAGEATLAHKYDATVHGAYLSGIKAAKEWMD